MNFEGLTDGDLKCAIRREFEAVEREFSGVGSLPPYLAKKAVHSVLRQRGSKVGAIEFELKRRKLKRYLQKAKLKVVRTRRPHWLMR